MLAVASALEESLVTLQEMDAITGNVTATVGIPLTVPSARPGTRTPRLSITVPAAATNAALSLHGDDDAFPSNPKMSTSTSSWIKRTGFGPFVSVLTEGCVLLALAIQLALPTSVKPAMVAVQAWVPSSTGIMVTAERVIHSPSGAEKSRVFA